MICMPEQARTWWRSTTEWSRGGQLNSGAGVSEYTRSVWLEPATDYVFSAYLWNMGDSANHVNAVIDLNDAPGEPQIVLASSDSEADKGYGFLAYGRLEDKLANLMR